MRKKSKLKSASTRRRRLTSGDAVHVQISVKTKKGAKFTKAEINRAILNKALASSGEYAHGNGKAGPDPEGMKIRIIWWTNHSRKTTSRGRRYANPDSAAEQDAAWGTLRRVIAKGRMDTREKLRSSGGVQ